MLSVVTARLVLCQSAPRISQSTWVALGDAYLRYSSTDVAAIIDVPPQANSAMDGYALNSNGWGHGSTLAISQTIAAGHAPDALQANTTARILTGAILPPGADCVAIQENCLVSNGNVTLLEPPAQGDNVRPRGQDVAAGEIILHKGQRATAPHLALLAAAGHAGLYAYRNPRIALLNTGSELIEPGQPLKSGQIYNSNQVMLSQLLRQWGCDVIHSDTLPDSLDATISCFKRVAETVDLIITSGGVSVGDEDHVRTAINSIGEVTLWKVNIKPGKPLAFGYIEQGDRQTPVLGLPGNPVSALTNALIFVKPFIAAMCGAPYSEMTRHCALADFTITAGRKRPEFVRARIEDGRLSLFGEQSSGIISSLTWANALAFIDAERTIEVGDTVDYYPLHELFY